MALQNIWMINHLIFKIILLSMMLKSTKVLDIVVNS